MLKQLALMFKVPDLRKKLFFVLALLAVFRLAAAVPVPGVNHDQLRNFLAGNQFFGLLNVFSGGVLNNLSIVMLGVGPFITASIIMQLVTMISPRLKEIYQEEGEAGRARFNQYTRYLAVPLAVLQAYALLTLLIRQGVMQHLGLFGYATNIVVAVAGTLFLMWIGELITEKNIGNGVSLIIFAGIVSRLPTEFQQELSKHCSTSGAFNCAWGELLTSFLPFIVAGLIVIAGVIIITEGQRNIPVSYAKRVRGSRMYGGVSTHLPLRVNQAGVVPIIFAISIILFPGLIGSVLAGMANPTLQSIGRFLVGMLNNPLTYGVIYFVFVFAFTYFYTAVTFDPDSIAENLQKQGGFVPGIRPGRPTSEFLTHVINRLTLTGALFLGVMAVLPLIVQNALGIRTITLGGTSLLIVVSVVLETMKQLEAQLVMREYEDI